MSDTPTGPKTSTRAAWLVLAVAVVFIVVGVGLYLSGVLDDVKPPPGVREPPQAEARKAAAEISSDVSNTVKAVEAAVPKTRGAGSELVALEADFKALMATSAAERDDAQHDLKSLDFPGFLNTERLQTETARTAAHQRLGQARQIIARHRALTQPRLDQFRAHMAAAPLPQPAGQAARERLGQTIEANGDDYRQLWDLDLAALDQYDAMVSLLSRTDGHWTAAHGNVKFARDADLKAFNVHARALVRIGQEEAELRRKTVARARRAVRHLKSLEAGRR